MKRSLAIASATLLGLGAVGLTSHHRTNRAWASMLVQLDALEAERLARPAEREALYGETTDGSAWEHYWRALDAVAELGDLRERGFRATRPENDAQRRDRDALVAEAGDALEHLHRGAHARHAASSVEFRRGIDSRIPKLVNARALAWIACAKLQMYAGKKNETEGLRAVLDVQLFARDLASSPVVLEEMMGCTLLVHECVQHFVATRGHTLSDDAKRTWLAALDQLAASIPAQSHAVLGDIERVGRAIEIGTSRKAGLPGSRALNPGWRYAFSDRLAAADYVHRGAAWGAELVALQRLPRAEMYAAARQIHDRAEDDKNPYVDLAIPRVE